MQKCKNCNTQFRWSTKYKSFWWGYKPIKCENCNAEHGIIVRVRIIFVSLTILPMLVFGFFLSPFDSAFVTDLFLHHTLLNSERQSVIILQLNQ
ncbi:TIGR04104 family putative zinc finger protein [Cytobacillus praedii]|uniref:TIGR04104 family putative zinc finger protein n=1 Tax=Cytobacillus praedii TaxID=1742358 RepID=UPI00399C88C4